jgi:hypothetical protein
MIRVGAFGLAEKEQFAQLFGPGQTLLFIDNSQIPPRLQYGDIMGLPSCENIHTLPGRTFIAGQKRECK